MCTCTWPLGVSSARSTCCGLGGISTVKPPEEWKGTSCPALAEAAPAEALAGPSSTTWPGLGAPEAAVEALAPEGGEATDCDASCAHPTKATASGRRHKGRRIDMETALLPRRWGRAAEDA